MITYLLFLMYIVVSNAFNNNLCEIKLNKPIRITMLYNKNNTGSIIYEIDKAICDHNNKYNSDKLYSCDGITSYSKYSKI